MEWMWPFLSFVIAAAFDGRIYPCAITQSLLFEEIVIFAEERIRGVVPAKQILSV